MQLMVPAFVCPGPLECTCTFISNCARGPGAGGREARAHNGRARGEAAPAPPENGLARVILRMSLSRGLATRPISLIDSLTRGLQGISVTPALLRAGVTRVQPAGQGGATTAGRGGRRALPPPRESGGTGRRDGGHGTATRRQRPATWASTGRGKITLRHSSPGHRRNSKTMVTRFNSWAARVLKIAGVAR